MQVFHSNPGSNDNVRVRCRPDLPGVCYGMTIYHSIADLEARVRITMREPSPKNWMPVSEAVRKFLEANVSVTNGC